MVLRRVVRPSPGRTWLLAAAPLTLWTFVVGLVGGGLVVEGTSKSVPAVSAWQGSAAGLAVVTLLVALAAVTSLRRHGAGPAQVLLAAALVVLVPAAALAAHLARTWAAEAPELALTGDDGGSYATDLARLLPLVVLAVALGWLAARLGGGAVPIALLAVTATVVATLTQGGRASAATEPTSALRSSLDVVVSGEPQRLVPDADTGCHLLVGPLCGQDLGVAGALGYVASRWSR